MPNEQKIDNFKVMQRRLNLASYSLSPSRVNGLYYVTDSKRRSYMLKQVCQGWVCDPLRDGDEYAAQQVLDIALGRGNE